MTSPSPVETQQEKKVGIGAYIALAFAVVIFSGVFYKMPKAQKWLGAFDFTTLIGKFGLIADSKNNFTGSGGVSARSAFLFSLTLIPGVMLAMGLIEVLAHYGALRAAQGCSLPFSSPCSACRALRAWPLLPTCRARTAAPPSRAAWPTTASSTRRAW